MDKSEALLRLREWLVWLLARQKGQPTTVQALVEAVNVPYAVVAHCLHEESDEGDPLVEPDLVDGESAYRYVGEPYEAPDIPDQREQVTRVLRGEQGGQNAVAKKAAHKKSASRKKAVKKKASARKSAAKKAAVHKRPAASQHTGSTNAVDAPGLRVPVSEELARELLSLTLEQPLSEEGLAGETGLARETIRAAVDWLEENEWAERVTMDIDDSQVIVPAHGIEQRLTLPSSSAVRTRYQHARAAPERTQAREAPSASDSQMSLIERSILQATLDNPEQTKEVLIKQAQARCPEEGDKSDFVEVLLELVTEGLLVGRAKTAGVKGRVFDVVDPDAVRALLAETPDTDTQGEQEEDLRTQLLAMLELAPTGEAHTDTQAIVRAVEALQQAREEARDKAAQAASLIEELREQL